MRKRSLIAAGLALAAVLGLLVAWVNRDAETGSWTFTAQSDPTLPPTVAVPPRDPAPPAVRRRALAVAERDELFRRLARGVDARLVSATPWGSIDGGLLGSALTFRLRRPVAIDAVLPIADIPPDSPTRGICERPYRQTWMREESERVTELSILVDLQRGKVADIATNASSGRRSWVDGKPHASCEPIAGG